MLKRNDIEWLEHHVERVRTEVVCRHHNPILVLDGKDGRASNDGLSRRGLWNERYWEELKRTYCVCCIAPLDADNCEWPRLWRGYVALVSKLSYFCVICLVSEISRVLVERVYRTAPVGWKVVHDVVVERAMGAARALLCVDGRACAF